MKNESVLPIDSDDLLMLTPSKIEHVKQFLRTNPSRKEELLSLVRKHVRPYLKALNESPDSSQSYAAELKTTLMKIAATGLIQRSADGFIVHFPLAELPKAYNESYPVPVEYGNKPSKSKRSRKTTRLRGLRFRKSEGIEPPVTGFEELSLSETIDAKRDEAILLVSAGGIQVGTPYIGN